MDNQNGNKDNNKNNKQGFSFVILITMLTALLVFAMYQFQGVDSDQEITYNKFLKMIDEKKVEKVEIKSDRILITAKKESGDKVNKEYYTGRMNDDPVSRTDRKYKKLKKECVEHSWIYQVRKRAEEFESFSSFD